MIKEAIAHVASGESLTELEATAVMEEIMTGEATPSQLGAFLTALHLKGETVDEITGLARVMREKALHVPLPTHVSPVDTCGTGGDKSGTFNVSTAAGLLVAACGQPVAKHGNRAATSRCGSADVLEALGIKIELKPEQVARCVTEAGFGFMFAPTYHPAMKHVGPTRREIGIRTVFNILGPLTNPAGAAYQVLGVPDAGLVRKMGEALLRLGCRRALVVYGEDGIDEISLSAPSVICEILGTDGSLREYYVKPEDFGITRQDRDAVRGGDAAFNAQLLRDTLSGRLSDAHTDMVSLNAGAALLASERVDTLAEGVKLARETLRAGRAVETLEAAASLSHAA
ncbi:MAG TPA: anthranilate phosphoribosyltransferase [Ktedonobacterales bacterium]|nr:anthranilate phosphoribosyltransferase [Ktedonobacterales bacterium]